MLLLLSPIFLIFPSFSQELPASIRSYLAQNPEDFLESSSTGSVSDGALINGKLMPYLGSNFCYFDSVSYLNDRAFVHDFVRKTILDTYAQFDTLRPNRIFYVMECSNKNGGKIYPHHTHQNGLSVDFMTPLLKNNLPYNGLDTIGADHYWLEFNEAGEYQNDPTVSIDFNLVAHHLLLLDQTARKYGLKISKVIFKLELKDELFA